MVILACKCCTSWRKNVFANDTYNTLSSCVHCRRSSWELPELRECRVKAISDSDGVSYPWYGNTTETVTLTGPTSKPSRLTVSMNDNFYPSVTWAVPISNSNTPMLTHITRDQSFITWLVAMNSISKVGQKYGEQFNIDDSYMCVTTFPEFISCGLNEERRLLSICACITHTD